MSLSEKRFDHLRLPVENIISSVTVSREYLSSLRCSRLQSKAMCVIESIGPLCEAVSHIVHGPAYGMALDHPGIERALCFPA